LSDPIALTKLNFRNLMKTLEDFVIIRGFTQ